MQTPIEGDADPALVRGLLHALTRGHTILNQGKCAEVLCQAYYGLCKKEGKYECRRLVRASLTVAQQVAALRIHQGHFKLANLLALCLTFNIENLPALAAAAAGSWRPLTRWQAPGGRLWRGRHLRLRPGAGPLASPPQSRPLGSTWIPTIHLFFGNKFRVFHLTRAEPELKGSTMLLRTSVPEHRSCFGCVDLSLIPWSGTSGSCLTWL